MKNIEKKAHSGVIPVSSLLILHATYFFSQSVRLAVERDACSAAFRFNT